MSKLYTEPKASSTTVKHQNKRCVENHIKNTHINDTFNSMFSDELTNSDLKKKTFFEMANNKTNVQTSSICSSFGQSSLGILELDNMSDIGSMDKRETFPIEVHNKQTGLQHRFSQITQARNTLSRASLIKNSFNTVNDNSVKTSLTNISNAFENMLKEGINNSNSSFSNEDLISGNEFKEKLAEIEEVNRKEFGSLSESRFNFSIEGEKQSIENGSFTTNYFATKSTPFEDFSKIFPKKQNNETFTKEKNFTFLIPNDIKSTPIGYKTMSSINSWTDSNVSNNLLNLTSLSDISEVLTSKTNLADPKELATALLTRDLSEDKQLNETNDFFQRRFSTSTRFFNSSYNLEHAEISFPSLESSSYPSPHMNSRIIEKDLELNNSINIKKNNPYVTSKEYINLENQCITINTNNLSNNFDESKTKILTNDSCHFTLTSKNGYFEDCTSETKIMDNNIDLTNFSILSNKHDVYTEMSLNKSINISKIVYFNESLCQNKLNQSYRKISKVLEIGNICIGTYSQVIITFENHLSIDAKYTLNLLDVSLDNTKNNLFIENKLIGKNIATILCSQKNCIIPALSKASFTIGIIPLVSGNISIHIQLKSNDTSQEINRNIQICSIEPQISWINNTFGSIDFGLLPELSQNQFPIKLLNKGTYQVPIKFILSQDQHSNIFARAIINPSELWQCDINFITSNILKNNCKTMLITGRIQIVLDSVEELSTNYSPLLFSSNLLGRIGLTSISFDQNPLILKKYGPLMLNGVVEITNNSELPITLSVTQNSKKCSELIFQPDKFQLDINEKMKMKIIFCQSNSSNYFSEINIGLQVVSSQKNFFFKVNCIKPNCELQQTSSLLSRPISPWSTSSSSAVGQLELESTCSSIIWGSIPSNTKSVQTFTLRNRGSHKEKLLLNIKDNKNCFKFITSGENQVSEMKLLLESMESQKLSVALISTSNEGEAYGQIVLQRQRSSEKQVISLFGYCGHSVIKINGPFEDNFGNMWLYPDPQLMTAQFSVSNSGNTTAFVKISQDNSSEDIIHPNEFILNKGETVTVEVTIVMSSERLEMIIEQDTNSKLININKISLIYGDEVSRIRVSRLWNKIKTEKNIVFPDQQRLENISNMFNGVNFANVDHLIDSEKSLSKLWKMGMNEDNINVLMEKSNLESLLCDTTLVFSELETTVINRLSQ